MSDRPLILSIGVLGGTGKEGKGLAYRWAKSGYRILIGSRTPEKSVRAAAEITELLDGTPSIVGLSNLETAQEADILVLTVPYEAHRQMLENLKDALKGKLLIDVTVPIVPPKTTRVQMPAAGSAAQEAREILGQEAEVAAAFQNISHELLLTNDAVECDVLVTGTSKNVRDQTLKLVEAAGLTGWDAGPLENSVVIEGLTSVLININKQYGSTHAGIKITGVSK